MKEKNELVIRSIEIKEEVKKVVLIRKRHIKVGKHIALMDFTEYLNVSENSKVYYGRFLRNGLHERHSLSKSR